LTFTLLALVAFANAANLYDQLGVSGFTGLQGALVQQGLASMFNTTNTTVKYTIFAPTNAALGAVNLSALSSADLTATLAFHVLPGEVASAGITNDLVVVDSNGKAKRFNIYGSGSSAKYTINGVVNIVLSGVNIAADNGIIHTVDKVIMIPTADESRTITAEVVANANFATLETALITAGIEGLFNNVSVPYTVFAPTDAAFAKLPAGLVAELLKTENRATLTSLLQYHVVAGTVYSVALSNNMNVTTLKSGSLAKVTITGSTVRIDSATVTAADLTRRNGVIHVIDTVLVPAGLTLPSVPSSNPPPSKQSSAATAILSVAVAAVAAIFAF